MVHRLLVKHAVGGRVFLDTNRDKGVSYALDKMAGGGWLFQISGVSSAGTIDALLEVREELNVFVFQETNGKAVQKSWFYVMPDGVGLDVEMDVLAIAAKSRIDYDPDIMMG